MNQVTTIIKAERAILGISKSQMARKLGISSQLYGQYENGKMPGANFFLSWKKIFGKDLTASIETPVSREFEDFHSHEPETNYTGKRLALKNSSDRKRAIPYYDAEAAGGMMETDMTAIHAPAGTIDVGDLLRDSEAAIRIYGNSMLPNYPPGCVVGLAKCSKDFIEPGEVYVIETRDRRLLKRIFYKDDASKSDKIYCYSDNIMKFEGGARNGKLAYPPFELPKKEIVNMFIVTGVIKRNANSVVINR